MMPTWEAFIQKGKEVYEKSNGEVYMWFSLEDIRQFTQEQSDMVWVNDGKINVENVFGRSLSLVTRFRDEHISDNLITWTPAWNEALREDRTFLPPVQPGPSNSALNQAIRSRKISDAGG